MGKRLGELTKDNTKCMIEVDGVTLIDRTLMQLAELQLSRIIIVTGYKGQKLRDHIGHRYDNLLTIEYINNPIYDKTNNIYSLALAKEQLQEDDTLLLESDLIFESSMLHLLVNSPYPNLALVAKYEPWMDGTMVRKDEDNNIVSFVPKTAFKYDEAETYYKTCNIYKFSKEFSICQYVPFLEAYCKAMGHNEYYEQVLRVLTILDKSDLKALPISNEKWYEIDDIQDRDIAETLFSDSNEIVEKYAHRFGGYWRFPQLKDFCYLVNSYFPPRRLVEELSANFNHLLTDYPSGMAVNSLLGGKYFGIRQEYVCMGNGAAELIKCLMEKHAQAPVGIVFPTFEEYPNRIPYDNIVCYYPQNENFSYTAADLMAFFNDKNLSTLLLVNPDNPSGNYIPKQDVMKLVTWAEERHILLVIDESFVDFTEHHSDNTLLRNGLLSAHKHLAVVKSISKSYGVPGLRLGIIASSDSQLINSLRHEVAIWNINSFAEYYLQIFNKYESDYRLACDRFIDERTLFYQELSQVSYLRIIPSAANYFLCEVTEKYTSHSLTERLLCDYNILIKDCGGKKAFAGKQYVRIAIRNRADDHFLSEILKCL